MVVVIVSMCRDSGGNSGHGVVVVVSTGEEQALQQTLALQAGGPESGTPSLCSYLSL
jgi:hypothetical protein